MHMGCGYCEKKGALCQKELQFEISHNFPDQKNRAWDIGLSVIDGQLTCSIEHVKNIG